MTLDEVQSKTTSTQFVEWQVRMAEETKREFDHVGKWEYYLAELTAILAETRYSVQFIHSWMGGHPRTELFKPSYFMLKFTYRTDEIDKPAAVDLSEEEQKNKLLASKSAWFGLVGIGNGVE